MIAGDLIAVGAGGDKNRAALFLALQNVNRCFARGLGQGRQGNRKDV